jgi:hypothetical protein
MSQLDFAEEFVEPPNQLRVIRILRAVGLKHLLELLERPVDGGRRGEMVETKDLIMIRGLKELQFALDTLKQRIE